jgi:hypothetical protein
MCVLCDHDKERQTPTQKALYYNKNKLPGSEQQKPLAIQWIAITALSVSFATKIKYTLQMSKI